MENAVDMATTLKAGFELMGYGLGLVFATLILLYGIIKAMALISKRSAGKQQEQ